MENKNGNYYNRVILGLFGVTDTREEAWMAEAAGPFQAEMPRFIRSNALASDRQGRGYMNRANAACTLFQCIPFSPAAEALIWVNVMCQSIASASEKVVCVLTPQDEGTPTKLPNKYSSGKHSFATVKLSS